MHDAVKHPTVIMREDQGINELVIIKLTCTGTECTWVEKAYERNAYGLAMAHIRERHNNRGGARKVRDNDGEN